MIKLWHTSYGTQWCKWHNQSVILRPDTTEIRAGMSNYIPYKMISVITYPCPKSWWSHISKSHVKNGFSNFKEIFCILIQNSTKMCFYRLVNNKSALVQVLDWCRRGDQPLPELLTTWFTDALIFKCSFFTENWRVIKTSLIFFLKGLTNNKSALLQTQVMTWNWIGNKALPEQCWPSSDNGTIMRPHEFKHFGQISNQFFNLEPKQDKLMVFKSPKTKFIIYDNMWAV